MGKRILLGAMICALFLCLGTAGFAQESSVKGNLGGVVVDQTGAVIPGAKVTLTGPTGNVSVTSDREGNFVFFRLNPGLYSVKVERQGFKAADVKNVEVAIGRTSSVRMQLAPGAATETVEVSASAVSVDTTSTASGANLSDAFYASVPVPRNVAGLFYVAPGVADSGGAGRSNPSISGGSGLENLYIADGVNITDGAFGGLGIFTRQYGSVGSGINLSFVKEVQVKTGGFEPQYGQATGGIVQIVTKSGGNAYHGTLAGYFAPVSAEATPTNVNLLRNRQVGTDLITGAAQPGGGLPAGALGVGPGSYDLDGEIGGYVPKFKEHLFFFGSYNPTLNTDYIVPPATSGQAFAGAPSAPVGLFTQLGGRPIYTRFWTNNYAAKLTYKINDRNTFETSVFGDPTSTNSSAFRAVNAQNNTVFSSQNYQTRNFVGRYNGTLSPTWLVNASVSWNHNEFNENPQSPGTFNVVDSTVDGLTPTLSGLGFVENHNADDFAYTIDTSKVVNFAGQHTFMIGFNNQFLNYDDIKSRTGGLFGVPDLGAARNGTVYGCATANGQQTCPLGFLTNASFTLRERDNCSLCPNYTNPLGQIVPVAAQISRGEYGPPTVATEGLYYAGYGNDTWQMNKYLTVSAGLRWEQYRMTGVSEHYTFTDNWAPRVGVVVDPRGNRKSKIYANFGRYNYQMPLDAAIRSLSSELDLTGLRFAPVIGADNSVTIVPDAAHVLNDLPPGVGTGGPATLSAQAGSNGTVTFGNIEGFNPGTKMQYEDEWIAGVEHDFGHGVIVSARYVDRRLKRVVEDMGGVSPEAALAGIPQVFIIGNPGSSLDAFTNEPNPTVISSGSCGAGTLVSASEDANGNPLPGGQTACFSGPNGADANGFPLGANGQTAGAAVPDGVPDGFANPVRTYKAVELEMNKSFSRNWLMRLNYRWASLRGNYEGAFRNDNGQTDPSISSLFDFRTGIMNLLGDQFAIGPLNTDRSNVVNGFFSYTFDKGFVRGLTMGTGVRVQSGTPLNTLANHPVYGNGGEVPFGGRGSLGRSPVTGSADLHAEYAKKLSERYTVRVGSDLFNITNTQSAVLIDQFRDISFQAPNSNLDFQKPLAFQTPFYARFSVKMEF
jgi:hypothetical protein